VSLPYLPCFPMPPCSAKWPPPTRAPGRAGMPRACPRPMPHEPPGGASSPHLPTRSTRGGRHDSHGLCALHPRRGGPAKMVMRVIQPHAGGRHPRHRQRQRRHDGPCERTRVDPARAIRRSAAPTPASMIDWPKGDKSHFLQHLPRRLCYDGDAYAHTGRARGREEMGWTLSQ
jgi:hypothetical protein